MQYSDLSDSVRRGRGETTTMATATTTSERTERTDYWFNRTPSWGSTVRLFGLYSGKVKNLIDWLGESDERIITVETERAWGATETHRHYVPTNYELTERKAFGSQQDCADAWADMEYPAHNVDSNGTAELYSSDNYRAFQRVDGTGRIMHYSTLCAIRTHSGDVIANQQDWSTGFARVTYPSETDYRLPLSSLSEVLSEEMSIYDIVDVHEPSSLHDARKPRLVELSDGSGVVLGYDGTGHEENDYMFRVTAEEVDGLRSVEETEELLKPQPVRVAEAQGMEIVGSDAPNDVTKADETIVRQGEWFFVPAPEVDPSPVYKYRRSEWDMSTFEHYVERPPSECDCGASSFEWNQLIECTECGETYLTESAAIDVPDAFDQLDSHEPRDVAVGPNGLYVRGTVRHNRNEHYVASLGETWHLAVEHDRDVMVYNPSHDGSRSRGRRRVEGRWD